MTEDFKNWFGDSKVAESGKPLVVYHGTNNDFTEFSFDHLGSSTGAKSARMGFFFAGNPKVASYYATGVPRLDAVRARVAGGDRDAMKELQEVQAQVDAVTLGSNPITRRMAAVKRELSRYAIDIRRDMSPEQEADEWGHVTQSDDDDRWMLICEYKQLHLRESELSMDAGIGENGRVIPVFLKLENPLVHDFKGTSYRDVAYANLLEQAADNGNDGVILKNTYDTGPQFHFIDDETDIYVVFSPEQIRNAISNHYDLEKASVGINGDGLFIGKVLEVADGVVTQKIGRSGDTVQHAMTDLSRPVAVGEIAEIAYKDGKAMVKNNEPSHSRGVQR